MDSFHSLYNLSSEFAKSLFEFKRLQCIWMVYFFVFTNNGNTVLLCLVKSVFLASNYTAYKRWSCHSGYKLLCKLC